MRLMEDKAQKIVTEFQDIEKQLSDPKIYSDPKKLVTISQKKKGSQA